MDMDNDNKVNVKEALFETIQSQIENRSPKETKEAYDRLVLKGCSHADSMRMIALALVREMNDALKSGRPFKEERYIKALKDLPR